LHRIELSYISLYLYLYIQHHNSVNTILQLQPRIVSHLHTLSYVALGAWNSPECPVLAYMRMDIQTTYYPRYPALYTTTITITNVYVSQQVIFPYLHLKEQHQLYLVMGSQKLFAAMVSSAYPNCSLQFPTALHPKGIPNCKCLMMKVNIMKGWRMMITS